MIIRATHTSHSIERLSRESDEQTFSSYVRRRLSISRRSHRYFLPGAGPRSSADLAISIVKNGLPSSCPTRLSPSIQSPADAERDQRVP